jgi:hypothetical protein
MIMEQKSKSDSSDGTVENISLISLAVMLLCQEKKSQTHTQAVLLAQNNV